MLVALWAECRPFGGVYAQYMDAWLAPNLLGDSGSLIRKDIRFVRHNWSPESSDQFH
jgi:hypothetical protein